MAKKAEQTASFMVRFNQRIYEEEGESKVQWRGRIYFLPIQFFKPIF